MCVFRVDEFNTKEFKRKVEKAKSCRELIQVLKVRISSIDFMVVEIDLYVKIKFNLPFFGFLAFRENFCLFNHYLKGVLSRGFRRFFI